MGYFTRTYFYPRSPCGERPIVDKAICKVFSISIHALLAESDQSKNMKCRIPLNFYPRSPCGERLVLATCCLPSVRISIHALLAESDMLYLFQKVSEQHFYPRSPCGERPCGTEQHRHSMGYFYPRSPCGERLLCDLPYGTTRNISIHALLAESDIRPFTIKIFAHAFLSTLSLRRATTDDMVQAQEF